jgi:hypothetical protein
VSDDSSEPRSDVAAGRVCAEARKALIADPDHSIGEFLEAAGQDAANGGRLGSAMRILNTMTKTLKTTRANAKRETATEPAPNL